MTENPPRSIDLFLSHNRAEKEWARDLAHALRELGLSVFFDEDSIDYGEDIVTAIQGALTTARRVLLLLSPRSVKSRWVELEWASAVHLDPDSRDRRLIPVLLQDCEIPLLVKRLRYIDARGKSVTQTAQDIQRACSSPAPSRVDSLVTKGDSHPWFRRGITGRPVEPGSPLYIERREDRRLETCLRRNESVLLFGPRKTGKTSMLHRIAAKETFRRRKALWLDFQMMAGEGDEDRLYEGVGWSLANQLDREWQPGKEPVRRRLHRLIREAVSQDGNGVTLLFDEYDMLGLTPAGLNLALLLRSWLSDPRLVDDLCCVIAGFTPPWTWPETSTASPWWNVFRPIRLSNFSLEESSRLLALACGEEPAGADQVFRLTGGHPHMVAAAAYDLAAGDSVSEVLERAYRLDGPFFLHARNMVALGTRSFELGTNTQGIESLQDLLNGREVQDGQIKEALWNAGVIADATESPPTLASEAVRFAIKYFVGSSSTNA